MSLQSHCPREMTKGLLVFKTTANWNLDTSIPISGTLCVEDLGNNKFSTRVGDGINLWKDLKNFVNTSDSFKSTTGTLLAGTDTITLPWSIPATEENILVFLGGIKLKPSQFISTTTTIKIETTVVFDTTYEVIYIPLSFTYPNAEIGYNFVIDGNLDFWYEGTSQTTNGYGSDTMWGNNHNGSTKTHTQQSFSVGSIFPDGVVCPTYYSRTVVTSVAGVSNCVYKIHCIEDVKRLAGKTVTISFYAKADATRSLAVELVQRFGSGGSPSADVLGFAAKKFTLSTTWTKYTLTAFIPPITGKTLGTNGDDRLLLLFWFDAGSNYDSRLSLGQQSGTFDLAKIALVIGGPNTAPITRTNQEESNLVNRYYFKIYNPNAQYARVSSRGITANATDCYVIVDLPVPMRVRIPTVTVTNLSSLYMWNIAAIPVATTVAITASGNALKGIVELYVASASKTVGSACILYQISLTNPPSITIDARL